MTIDRAPPPAYQIAVQGSRYGFRSNLEQTDTASRRGTLPPPSRGGSTAPNSRGGSTVPSYRRDSAVPSSRGGSIVLVSRAGSGVSTSCGMSIFFPCTLVSGSRNGTSMTVGSLSGSQTFSQDLPSKMMHAPQHPLSSDEHQPCHLSVALNSDEEESQIPDEYYRAHDDFPFESTQPQPPTVGTVSIRRHSFHLHSHCQSLRILTLTRYLTKTS